MQWWWTVLQMYMEAVTVSVTHVQLIHHVVQEAYAQYIAKDDSGAISAFLDDGGVRMLQAAVAKAANGQVQVRLTNAADFPQGCCYQVRFSQKCSK